MDGKKGWKRRLVRLWEGGRGRGQRLWERLRGISWPRLSRRRALAGMAAAGLVGVLAAWGARQMVVSAAAERTYDDVAAIPQREAALVLGCSERLASGWSNLFFQNRIEAAAALYKAGKVKYLIVSGDNHVASYDEPTDMKRALVGRGVPAEAVYCDYAGFRTLDSVVRAKAIFGQSEIIIVSQKFHNQRAIFLASHQGIDAIGFNARDLRSRLALRTRIREQFARVRTVLDVYLFHSRPKFYGPPVHFGDPQA